MQFQELPPGASVLGEKIHAYKTLIESKKFIYLLGAVHGDEIEGAHVMHELFQYLKKEHRFTLPLIVVPIVNVDGFAKKTRVNHNGVDLNRNLPTEDWNDRFEEAKYNPGKEPLSEPENQFLQSLFLKYQPAFILSFHSWKPILNFNGDCKDIAEYLAKFNQYPLDGDIGYPTPGSLGTYGPEVLKCPVLTFECPPISSALTLQSIWKENEQGLLNLMGSDLLRKKL
jgi:protein MpaA